jgi:hypothetical protein
MNIKIVALCLFLLNFIAGMLFINEGLFYHDSVVLAKAVEDTYDTGIVHPAIKGRCGLVIINSILYLPFRLFGQNADFVTRFSSVLFHSLSIVALFLFVNALFKDPRHALFGALLLSFTPFYFSPNTFGKEHGASIFFILASFYLLRKGNEKNNKLLIALSSMLLAVSISVKESAIIAIPLYVLLHLSPTISIYPFIKAEIPKDRLSKSSLIAITLPFLTVFSIIFLTYLKDELYIEITSTSSPTSNLMGIFSPMLNIAIDDLLTSVPNIVFISAILGIFLMLKRKTYFFVMFLLIWTAAILYFGNTKNYCARFLDIIIIPIYILCSYYISNLYNRRKLIAILIMAYCVLRMFLFMYPMLSFRHNYNGEKRFALYVKENTEDDAVVIAMDDGPFIEYYGERETIVHPINDQKNINEFFDQIDALLVNNTPVYLIESGLGYDSTKIFRKELFRRFRLYLVGEKLCEDYHRPELKLNTYNQRLFKLSRKQPTIIT